MELPQFELTVIVEKIKLRPINRREGEFVGRRRGEEVLMALP